MNWETDGRRRRTELGPYCSPLSPQSILLMSLCHLGEIQLLRSLASAAIDIAQLSAQFHDIHSCVIQFAIDL